MLILYFSLISGEYSHAQNNLDRVLEFIRIEHGNELYGYAGQNVGYILKLLGDGNPFENGNNSEATHDINNRHRRYAHHFDSSFAIHSPEDDGNSFLSFQKEKSGLRYNSTNVAALPWLLSRSVASTYYGYTASRLIRENMLLKADIANMYALLDSGNCDSLMLRRQHVLARRHKRDTIADDITNGHTPYNEDERNTRAAARARAGASHAAGSNDSHLDANNNDVNSTNHTKYEHHAPHEYTQAELLHEIAHYLHFCSVAILGIFVLQVSN